MSAVTSGNVLAIMRALTGVSLSHSPTKTGFDTMYKKLESSARNSNTAGKLSFVFVHLLIFNTRSACLPFRPRNPRDNESNGRSARRSVLSSQLQIQEKRM